MIDFFHGLRTFPQKPAPPASHRNHRCMKSRLFALLLLIPLFTYAQAPEDPAHAELRTMRDGLLAAMNKGDIEAQLPFLHPNVVITWHNAEVSRGTDGVRAYLQKQFSGPTKQVDKFSVEAKVDELSILYGGDTAIAFGSADEKFVLKSGRTFALTGRWSATMVKENGKWLIANLHASDNIFDNPLLNQFKGIMPWVGGSSLIMGMLLGWLVARRGMAK